MGHAAAARETTSLVRVGDYFVGRFMAMAGPCEVLVDTDDEARAATARRLAEAEAQRIERAFSRYRSGNIVHRINHARGRPVAVDVETALLLDYAATCHRMSEGLFDITSGALRRVWRFDGSDRVPDEAAVREVLQHVGWHRVRWENRTLTMPEGMEIDLGGLGKEYAVDRSAAMIATAVPDAFLVNYGGDLFASAPRRGGRPWAVGLDDPDHTGEAALYRIDLRQGGLATSGDSRRFILHQGRRLGHILDPRTGWPIENAARSVTVVASSCLEAGTLSTLAYLQGPRAAQFLGQQGVQFRVV
jgi:thiamine biosynthesis lipoprotein